MNHRLPQRRTLRLVKKEILRHVEEEMSWEVDLTEEIGVWAAKRADQSRITYVVTDPKLLNECARSTIGLDLLSSAEFERIVKAARVYYILAMGENEKYKMVTRPAGHDFRPNVEHYSKLDEALRRIGQ